MENLNKRSGIYIIKNIIDGKIYVGSACNLKSRINNHIWSLRKNKHANIKLQRAYDKYGENSFTFNVLEFVDIDRDDSRFKEILLEREQYWIDKTRACERGVGYNIMTKAGSNIGYVPTEETRKNISKKHKGKSFNDFFYKGIVFSDEFIQKMKEGIKNSKKRRSKRYVINIDTGKKYDYIKLAEDELGIDSSSISMVCRGKMEMAGGFRWRYLNKDGEIIDVNYRNKHKKPVINLDTLETFESVTLAAKNYNVSKAAIYNNIVGKSKTSCGYHWQYYEDYLKEHPEGTE